MSGRSTTHRVLKSHRSKMQVCELPQSHGGDN